MKKTFLSLVTAGIVLACATFASAAESTPKTLLHIVTVDFKKDASEEQVKAALDGASALPAKFPGIKRVWTKTVKSQGRAHVIAMEFESEKALKDYADSDAQKEWYKVYTPIRDRSTTFDVSN